MVPLWVRHVISLCAAKGGRITAEEIANIAACARRYAIGSRLVSALKINKNICVEIIGEEAGSLGRKIKVYRVTRRVA